VGGANSNSKAEVAVEVVNSNSKAEVAVEVVIDSWHQAIDAMAKAIEL
jgi:hypothetical protein